MIFSGNKPTTADKTSAETTSGSENSVFTYLQLKKWGVPERWIEYILKCPNEQTERFKKYRARTEERLI